jgi:hypothetical protein
LKAYCMEVLHLTEDQAYSRIAVARVAQKFPVVLEMLADGLVHLTAVERLGPSLTPENHLSILEEATFKSMAQVEEMVARLRPRPPVPSSIRKLGSSPSSGDDEDGFFDSEVPVAGEFDDDAEEEQAPLSRTRRSRISPLAPGSHDIHITADDELMYALRELQQLLSHQVPSGDPAVIIKHSLLRTLKEVKKEKFGTGRRRTKAEEESSAVGAPVEEARVMPEEGIEKSLENVTGQGTTKTRDEESQSRYIPKEIRKAVWERDEGRCAYRSIKGRWCTERRYLEFHHIIPFAWRGETTVDNLELRCRTHNAYEGDLLFGKVLRKSDPKYRLAASRTGINTSSTTRKAPRAEVR